MSDPETFKLNIEKCSWKIVAWKYKYVTVKQKVKDRKLIAEGWKLNIVA